MARNLRSGLRQSLNAGLAGGFASNDIFTTASLDLNFAKYKNIGSLIDFSRASSGTYVGSDGLIKTATTDAPRFDHDPTTGESLGLLVEESRANLVTHSGDLGNVAWVAADGASRPGVTVTAPDGTDSAIQLDVVSTGTSRLYQTVSVTSGATYTLSVYMRVASGTLAMKLGNINVGVYKSVTVTDEWQRFEVTQTASSDPRLPAFASDNANGSVYLWGAQLEAGSFPTSYIPTTGTTVTRAADVADISGNNFGTTNLLSYSEEFDHGTWAVTGAPTLTPNATIAPNGTMTADRLQSTGGNTGVQQVLNLELAPHSYSLYVKQAGLDSAAYVRLSLGPFYFSFDLVNGTFFDVDAGFSTPVATQVGNGWWRISGTRTTTATANAIRIWNVLGGSPSDVYIWGAQLEQSDVATPYVKSNVTWNSRASNATYYDSTGTIRKSSYNELLWSEEFDNASWLGGSTVMTANTQIAPNGTTTADTLTASSGVPNFYQVVTCTPSTAYTFSFYVRLGTLPASEFRFAIRDDTNGVFIAVDIVPDVTPVTTEWRRVTYTLTTPAGCLLLRVYPYRSTVVTGGTAFLWGAQLEKGTYAGDYAKTEATAASTARNAAYLPDDNGNFVSAGPLLLEEQRANVITNNTMVGAVAGTPGTLPTNWSATTPANGITREILGTGTEDGIAYIDFRFSGTNTLGSNYYMDIAFDISSIAVAQGQTWTESVYARLLAGAITGAAFASPVNMILYGTPGFNDNAVGALGSDTNARLVQQRFSLAKTFANAGTTGASPRIGWTIATGGTIDFTLRIGLPQLEQGAFATSVIPTYGIAATRSADVSTSTSGFGNSWYRQDEGTVFVDVKSAPVNNIAQLAYDISDGTNNERMFQRRTASSIVGVAVLDNGVTQGDIGFISISATARYRSGFAYKLNDLEIVVNGAGSATDTSAILPTPNQIHIGQTFASAQSCNGTIRRLCYWKTRLPNSTLSTITQ